MRMVATGTAAPERARPPEHVVSDGFGDFHGRAAVDSLSTSAGPMRRAFCIGNVYVTTRRDSRRNPTGVRRLRLRLAAAYSGLPLAKLRCIADALGAEVLACRPAGRIRKKRYHGNGSWTHSILCRSIRSASASSGMSGANSRATSTTGAAFASSLGSFSILMWELPGPAWTIESTHAHVRRNVPSCWSSS